MNPTLAELYQRVILQHNREPQNFGPLPQATHHASLHNALCGDQVLLHLRLDPTQEPGDGEPPRIVQARFEGDGCALSRASASLLTQHVIGCTPQQALAQAAALRQFLQPRRPGDVGADATAADAQPSEPALGDLVALQGVRDVPSRLRCATLPWEALVHALQGAAR